MADNDISNEDFTNNGSKSPHSEGANMSALTNVPTSVTLSAEQFERLYLSPLTRRQPALSKQLGNPTPL